MKLIKLIGICLSVCLTVCLTGCEILNNNIDELLDAPKLEGNMLPVQKALEEYAGDDITLKYPMSGEYRSAFILKDLNNDNIQEAIAFYSTTSDSTVLIHINLISFDGEQWQSIGDLSLVGNGIERVNFLDVDGNGQLEIIVGWMIYGVVEKQVGIYTYDGELLTQRAIEPYTDFICADLTGDTVNDISVFYLNSSEKTASAKLFSLTSVGINEVGSIKLDGGVSSYYTPVLSKLSDGTSAIYIDAIKGTGTLTEIIWYKDGQLHGIYDAGAPETSLTYRNSTVNCRDYNGNGIIDIPISELLASTAQMAETDKVYYTNWSEFNGKSFSITQSTFMNYTDGYSISVPEKWKDKLLLIRKTEARMRLFYTYDSKTGYTNEEILRIMTVSYADYVSGTYTDEYIRLGASDNLVYLAKINPDNTLGITEKHVREMFSIIK